MVLVPGIFFFPDDFGFRSPVFQKPISHKKRVYTLVLVSYHASSPALPDAVVRPFLVVIFSPLKSQEALRAVSWLYGLHGRFLFRGYTADNNQVKYMVIYGDPLLAG